MRRGLQLFWALAAGAGCAGADIAREACELGCADAPPVVIRVGAIERVPLDCKDTPLPTLVQELDWSGIRMLSHWGNPVEFANRWISDNQDRQPSLRVHPERVPQAGQCLRDHLRAAMSSRSSQAVLEVASAFADPTSTYGSLARTRYRRPPAATASATPIADAIDGLRQLDNPLRPPALALELGDRHRLTALEMQLSSAARQAIADLVHAVGEASLLRERAFAELEPQDVSDLHEYFLRHDYGAQDALYAIPGDIERSGKLLQVSDRVDLSLLHAAALAVAGATDRAAEALAHEPLLSMRALRLPTAHGDIILDPSGVDNEYVAGELDNVALLVDLGGDDRYHGHYASTTHPWMSASVVLDVRGNDRYGASAVSAGAANAPTREVFDHARGFTQGAGLFGVGLLHDVMGNDSYRASVFAQGASIVGVGLLVDDGGDDRYDVAHFGQGAGFFGSAIALDQSGNDEFRSYTMGMGVARPGGVGLLVDGDGDDAYLCYHAEDPELTSSPAPNHFGLDKDFWYHDAERAHYMSICQGVGWGYRGDWTGVHGDWMGGLGALVDFGPGNDRHVADVFSMGMGFMYGFGFLYDDGGDDDYRSFWWGPAAAAHMGVGLFWDEAGNDAMKVTRASGSFGFDYGVAWLLDRGGDDRYEGQVHYGESYTWGLSFFVNLGGDDHYNADGARKDVPFGIVHKAKQTLRLFGLFLDLGQGNDRYENAMPGPANGNSWRSAPIGADVDPAKHSALGLDDG